MYNPDPNTNFSYTAPNDNNTENTNFVIEINKFNNKLFNSVSLIGITFVNENIPIKIKITLIDNENNNIVLYDKDQYGNILLLNNEITKNYNAQKLIFDFIGIKNSNTVKIGRIYLGSNMERGNTYIDKYNSKVFGYIEFLESKGSIIIKSNDRSKFKLRVSNDGTLSTTKL